MSKLNNKKIGLNSIFDKIKEKYNEVSFKRRSLSQDILIDFTEEVIVRNLYKKTKITLKRPKKEKNKKPKSASKETQKHISLNNYKNNKNENINFNKNISSAQNKILKFENNNIKIVSKFNDLKEEKVNNKKEISLKLLKVLNCINKLNNTKLKKKYFDKMKCDLFTNSKIINSNLNNNNSIRKIHSSISCDINNKSKLENKEYKIYKTRKINSSNNYEIIRNNSSKKNSIEKNIKIIKRVYVKQLYNSEDENNSQNMKKKDNQLLNSKDDVVDINKNKNYNLTENRYSLEYNPSNEDKNGTQILDILKNLRKKKINKIGIKNNFSQKFKTEYTKYNHFIPKIPIKNVKKMDLIYNNSYSINKNNNKFLSLNSNEDTTLLINNANNNQIIKQSSPIFKKYNTNKYQNNEKDININYINSKNNACGNIINRDYKYNNMMEKEFNNALENNSGKKEINNSSFDKNFTNIIYLTSPVKNNYYYNKNIKHFIPDKTIDKKIKLFQPRNKTNVINDYFNKYEINREDKLLSNNNTLNKSIKKRKIIHYNNSKLKINTNQINNNYIRQTKIIKSSLIKNRFDNNKFIEEERLKGNSNYNLQFNSNKRKVNEFDSNENDNNIRKSNQECQINYSLSKISVNSCGEKNIVSFEISNQLNSNHGNNYKDLKKDINSPDINKDIANNFEHNLKIENNNKKIINNNYIEKNGELFYSVRESNDNIKINNLNNRINNNPINMSLSLSSFDENETNNEYEDIYLNSNYFKFKIINKKSKIIAFLSNNEKNEKKLKAKIPLKSYINIIRKIIERRDKNSRKEEEMNSEDRIINIKKQNIEKENNTNIKSLSIRNYQNFLNKLMNEIELNIIDIKDYLNQNNINNNNLNLNIQILENKIKSFKKYIIFLLIKKHYTKSISLKEKLITDKSKNIEKRKDEIYRFFISLKAEINSNIDSKKNKQKREEYFMKILDILKHYEYITRRDIKKGKYLFKQKYSKNNGSNKELINNEKKIDYKNKKLFMALSIVVLPLLYIFNYLNSYKKIIL